MGFSDTLKEALDQGIQVSRDMASKAGEKAQVWGEKGLEASREFAVKAGATVQKIGEKGIFLLEIKQLEGQARKLIAGLGAKVYKAYEDGAESADLGEGELKTILDQIAQIKNSIEKREVELKSR